MVRIEHPGRAAGDDAPGRLESVQVGHPDVHEDDVGPEVPVLAQGLGPVGRLANDSHIRLAVENDAEPGSDQLLVVNYENFDHGRPTRRVVEAAHRDQRATIIQKMDDLSEGRGITSLL